MKGVKVNCTTIVVVVLLSVVSVSLAAVGIGPAVVHDSHPNQCYNEKTESYYSPGESWPLQGCAKAECFKYSQSKLMISYESCGVAAVASPCYMVEDKTKPYPDCCAQVVCPESYADAAAAADQDENETYDESSEELSSGLNINNNNSNRTSPFSAENDLDGTAVHFTLAQQENGGGMDRSNRNDLESLEDDDDDEQDVQQQQQEPVKEESVELAQPRRIPFRFRYASLYDIGSGHEQRLNDVDANEDYQLV